MNPQANTEVKRILREFILNSINVPDLGDDDNLFESGIVNSLFAVQLLTFIEKTFRIEVGVEDLDIDNFKSVDAAARFISRSNGLVHSQEPGSE